MKDVFQHRRQINIFYKLRFLGFNITFVEMEKNLAQNIQTLLKVPWVQEKRIPTKEDRQIPIEFNFFLQKFNGTNSQSLQYLNLQRSLAQKNLGFKFPDTKIS